MVTPHASFIALDVVPQQAYANIQALRTDYPGVYGPVGFFDAVMPRELARDPGQTVFSYGPIISPPRDWDRWADLVGALAAPNGPGPSSR